MDPDPALVLQAGRILENSGVVVFPTTGLYGLGADARSHKAVRKVFSIKRRPACKPVLVLVPGIGDLEGLVDTIPDYASHLLALWPGGLTLVFRAGRNVPSVLTGGSGKIGVRLPAHPVAWALADAFGGPITGTSANLSGFPAVASAAALAPELVRETDLVMDAGPLAGGPGSTIVDVTIWPVAILREGAVKRRAIEHALR